MAKTSVQCPKCGANIQIEAPEVVTIVTPAAPLAVAVSLPPKNKNEAEAKIEALRAAGVDVSSMFSIRGCNGKYDVGRVQDGQIVVIPENDPIFKAIRNSRTIPNRNLFRRWVMAQVFHMMTVKDFRGEVIGFTEALHNKGYKYQWDMLLDELRVQTKLYEKDPENFTERNRWFNKAVVVAMASDYIKLVQQVIKTLRIKHCKGVPYIRLDSKNIFVDDIPAKVYAPLEKLLKVIKSSRNPTMLFKAASNFFWCVKKTYIKFTMQQSKAFVDAYKGAGAFYTLKNLILFHGYVFPKMAPDASIAYLKYLVSDPDFEGYKLFGIMKEFLKDNYIDIAAKQAEWRQ